MASGGLRDVLVEIGGQARALESFSREKLPEAPAGSIFVGAGDSYAAALAGFYASGGRCVAMDPYSLGSEPRTARGRDVFFVSASGRTASNVYAAKAAKLTAKRTYALTADERSPLAEQVGKAVRIPMTYTPKTPGILSFSLSALAVLRMAGARSSCDFARTFKAAKKQVGEFALGTGATYFLGNSLAYPAALYGAAKVYELLGARAQGELLEEFSHLELFSLKKGDAVNAFSHFDPSGLSARLATGLRKEGVVARVSSAHGRNRMERFFHCVFLAQLWAASQARKAGFDRPRFLDQKKKLRISDSMIY